MHYLQVINSDISVLIVCNKTGGTIKGDTKKIQNYILTLCLNFFVFLSIPMANIRRKM